MRYNKPQILTVTRATDAIKGEKRGPIKDNALSTVASYEDNE